jgi:hypothetical protein
MTSQIVFPARKQPDQKVWLRRLITGFLLAAIPVWGVLSTLVQPVSAKPGQQTVLSQTIVINEIGWDGTASNANAEWIELYNPGPTPIDLTNWKLQSSDSSPDITFTAFTTTSIIPANGYFLLERTGDSTINNIAADYIYTGALSNTGEALRLYDSSNVLIDTANDTGGAWPSGESTTPCSMERRGALLDDPSSWITSTIITIGIDSVGNPVCGSPKSQNSQFVTPTFTPTFSPTPVGARRVLINEIAWAGTQADGSMGQWIELYNPGSSPIDITDWHLIAADSVPDIPLSGSISANGYFLLARRIDVFQSLAVQQVFSDSFSSSGESLNLFTGSGELIDTANSDGGPWPAGTGFVPYRSMERNGANLDTDAIWITFSGTPTVKDRNGNFINGSPGLSNWSDGMTQTPSPTPTSTNTPTTTSTATITLTMTSTPTRTLTSTRTLTPTRTRTPIRTLTPTRTRTPAKSSTPQKSLTPTPNRATPEPIILNEFLPQPHTDWNGDGKVDSGDEFIELKNLSTTSISISGYRLDDQDGGSAPYTIKDVTMQPGTRMVFFTSETGILLSSGGDSVRLYKPSGSLPADAFTYGVVKIPDQSWCRLPDNKQYIAITWKSGCEPTPNEVNKLAQSVFVGNRVEAAMCLRKDLPFPVYLAECEPLGLEMWSQPLWDILPPDFPRFFDLDTQEFILE